MSRAIPVSVFLMDTVALGTAEPDASVTVPESVAPETCANIVTPDIKQAHIITTMIYVTASFFDIPIPMQRLLDNHRGLSRAIRNLRNGLTYDRVTPWFGWI